MRVLGSWVSSDSDVNNRIKRANGLSVVVESKDVVEVVTADKEVVGKSD